MITRSTPVSAARALPAPRAAAAPRSWTPPAATTGNVVRLHVTPDESLDALLSAIRGAKRSFYVEVYKWHDEEAGRAIAEALIAKKREAESRGEPFDAKVLFDWSGSSMSAGGHDNSALLARLREGGVEVLAHAPGPIQWKARRVLPLTHRKLFIADGDTAITGGRNLADKYMKDSFAHKDGTREASFHDLMVSVRGPEAGRLREEFLENWVRAGGKRPAHLAPVPAPAPGGSAIRTVVTDPHDRTHDIRRAHAALIAGAREEIVAIYPYFSDDRLIASLVETKRRNPAVRVKVLLPGVPEKGLEGGLFWALNKETARQLLKAGVEVRAFEGGDVERFSHMKALMVDGRTLSIGSANADARTFRSNHELNLLIEDPAVAARFEARVAGPDWAQARPITLRELKADPWHQRLWRRVLEAVDFLL